MTSSNALSCLFCLGRLRTGVTACKDCHSSLWRLEHLDRHWKKAQNHMTPTVCQSIAQPVSYENLWSDSTVGLKKNNSSSHARGANLFLTMKRKMGLSPSGFSSAKPSSESSQSHSLSTSPDGRMDKRARTCKKIRSVTKKPERLNLLKTDDGVGRIKDCQAEMIAARVQKTNPASKTKHAFGILTGPLIHAKDNLSSEIHQILERTSQRKPVSLRLPSDVNSCHRLSDFSCSSALSAPVSPAINSSLRQTAWQVQPAFGISGNFKISCVAFPFSHFSTLSSTSSTSSVCSQFHHSSSQSSATSHLQNQSRLILKEEETEMNQDSALKKESHVTLKEEHLGDVEKKVNTERDSAALEKNASSAENDVIVAGASSGDFDRPDSCKEVAEQMCDTQIHREMFVSKHSDLEPDTCTNTEVLDDYKAEKYHQKLKQLSRQWEFTRLGTIHHTRYRSSRSRQQPVEFTVMTYNILAQNLIEDHPSLYTSSNSHSLEWKQRRRRLIAEIACHNPDIINLQEVHRDHFLDYLKPRLDKLGYTGCYQKRTGDKLDGCATLWKKEKFQLLQFSPVNYCRGGLLDRDNIAIIVELQPIRSTQHHMHDTGNRQTDDKIVVANTHLLFNPRRGDIKLAQLMILLAEVDKHAYLGPSVDNLHSQSPVPHPSKARGHYCPVILTGDFNMEPQSDLYKFVVSGRINYEGLLLRQMSGQEEGQYGRNHLLDRNFFSPMYGVTDSCQYHTAVVGRLGQLCGMEGFPEPPESGDRGQSQRYRGKASSSSVGKALESKDLSGISVSTGHLEHQLNLVSAYRHRIERLGRAMEVTTHHNRGRCSVDYIFYSVDSKHVRFQHNEVRLSSIRDGKLKLLARYGLMSAKELDDMGGIPNQTLPSDHLCLITKFLLT